MAMFRNVMVYLGLGPDDEYDDGYFEDDVSPNERLEQEVRRETMAPAVVARPAARSARSGGTALGDPPAVVRADVGGSEELRLDDPGRLPTSDFESSDLFGSDDAGGVGAVRPLRAVPDDPIPPSQEREPADTSFFGRADHEQMPDPHPEGGPAMQEATQPQRMSQPTQRTKPVTVTPASFGDAKLVADEFRDGVPVIMNLQGVDRDVARRLIDFASGICYCMDGSMEKAAPQVFLLTPSTAVVSEDDRRRMEDRGYDR